MQEAIGYLVFIFIINTINNLVLTLTPSKIEKEETKQDRPILGFSHGI